MPCALSSAVNPYGLSVDAMSNIQPPVALPPTPILPPQYAAPGEGSAPVPRSNTLVVQQTALPPIGEFRSRMDIDGVPYVGPPVMLREPELAKITHHVSNHVTRLFNVTDETQRMELEQLMDRVSRDNGMVRQYKTRWVRNPTTKAVELYVYVHAEFVTLQLNRNTEQGKLLLQAAQQSGRMGSEAARTPLDAERDALNAALSR